MLVDSNEDILSPELIDETVNHSANHQQDDFDSIDWMVDRNRYLIRRRFLTDYSKKSNLLVRIKILFDEKSGWIIIILLGFIGGITASLVNAGVQYLSDIRQGVCTFNLLYKREECCWDKESITMNGIFSEIKCSQWLTWGELMGFTHESTGDYIIGYVFYILISLFYVLFSALAVKQLAPYAIGGGIAEIKAIMNGFILHGYLGFTTYLVKTLTLIPTVASGLVLGQEAPMVHICCCLANFISRLFPSYKYNEAKRRDILSAGAASGVAIAFRAPIGGVLFSFEEISYYFPIKTLWITFFCCLIGTMTLSILDPFQSGSLTLYLMNYTTTWKLFEIVFFIFLGVLGGLYGVIFTVATLKWNSIKNKIKIIKNPLFQIVSICLITTLLSYPNEFTRISNHHLINSLFTNCEGTRSNYLPLCHNSSFEEYSDLDSKKEQLVGLIIAIALKSILMVFTNGLKIPVGLFVPSLAIGACVGRLFGVLLESLYQTYPSFALFSACSSSSDSCILPGTYAVIGAASFLSGVTQITVSLVVIMVELTGQMSFIVPIMIAVMCAKLAYSSLKKDGLYESTIILNKFPFLENIDHIYLKDSLNTYLNSYNKKKNIQCFSVTGLSVTKIKKILIKCKYRGFPVVYSDDFKYLVGYITRSDLESSLDYITLNMNSLSNVYVDFSKSTPKNFVNTTQSDSQIVIGLSHIVQNNPVTLSVNSSMEMAYYLFQKLGIRKAFILNNGKLCGIITKKRYN